MDKNQKQSSKKEKEKNESNNSQKIGDESQNNETNKTNSEKSNLSKNDFSSNKKSSNLSASEKRNDNINKKNKNLSQTSKSKITVDNLVDNKDRYEEVMEGIRKFEDKLDNKGNTNEEIPIFINQDNFEEQNNDINELKNQLVNVKNDEKNIIDFTNKIEGLLSSRQYEFNDKIFEKTVTELFYRKYNLTKFNAFKFINLIKSKDDNDFTAQVDYFRIMINDSNENKEYVFFKDRDYYPIYYKNIFFLFEKNSQGIPDKIAIYSNNFKYLTQFRIEKFGQNYIFPIYKAQLSEQFLEIETKKNKLQSKLHNISDDKQSNETEKENLAKQINKLQNEQNQIINLEEKKKEISEKIKKKESLNFDSKEHFAIITIEYKQNELDGFYKTEEKITIKNKYSTFEIPKNSYIIVEVKNYKKYEEIRKNIRIKKSLLNKLGIDIKNNNFYFIGIINDFDSDRYSQEVELLKEENIFIITENDVKIEEKSNIYVNYSKVDKDIKDIKSDIDDIKLTIKNIENILNNLTEAIKPLIEDYNERKKINKNN